MAITIDSTVGGANSNSYLTLAEAETYFDSRLYTDTWDNSSTANKNIALVMATRLLDDWVDWNGYKVDDEDSQALRWPRYDVQDRDGYTYDSDIIPQWLKDATAELAQYLLGKDVTAEPDTTGFSEISVDVIRLKIDKADRDRVSVIPDSVKSIVEPYGLIRSRGTNGTITLVRA